MNHEPTMYFDPIFFPLNDGDVFGKSILNIGEAESESFLDMSMAI